MPTPPRPSRRRSESGQVLVLVAVAFIGMAAFIGLAIDLGILFVNQAYLRRTVDAAALAAASQIREGQQLLQLGRFARQFVRLNNLDAGRVRVQICNTAGTGINEYRGATDSVVSDLPLPSGDPLCGPPRRKQVRVVADQDVNFTFLGLIGLYNTTISANAISEAASIDMVIVLDTSMSMGNDDARLNDPAQAQSVAQACNNERNTNPEAPTGKCRPLWDTKQAAKDLIQTLYEPYDRVAVVTFDFDPAIAFTLSSNLGERDPANPEYVGSVYERINDIQLNIDSRPPDDVLSYNPLNTQCQPGQTATCLTAVTSLASAAPYTDPNGYVFNPGYARWATLSTCSGCGLRVAGSLLKFSGRPEAVWVMVFLSDGSVNTSDLPGGPLQSEFGFSIPNTFPNGFCAGPTDPNNLGTWPGLWRPPYCATSAFLSTPDVRQCGVWPDDGTQCPPGTTYVGDDGYEVIGGQAFYYDAHDYARDMADQAALLINCRFRGERPPRRADIELCSGAGTDLYNENEPVLGSPMTIYSIALGRLAGTTAGSSLLRYVAAVGDDGDRATDPCTNTGYVDGTPLTPQTNCGNYYYAPSGGALGAVFEDIAEKIFTRLTR
ncbi:MAG: hypothetical protein JNK29_09680 [Anaerolineales bacterium]|nr:hypothetical protein [Anaerolineales bacterium]